MNWDRIERLFGGDVLDHLQRQTVGIIGLGSGGSFVAVSLAMSGVGRFILIDDDLVGVTNVVRHAADLRDVGQPKVEAVAHLIRQRNPRADVQAVAGRIEDHLDLLPAMQIVVAGVDNERPKFAINQACLAADRVAIYAGVYERGEGGDVSLIYPGDGPCYACWAERLREGVTSAPPEGELDYGMIDADGTLKAEPALWLHVVRVAAAQADMTLNQLLRETDAYRAPPANTVVLANTYLEVYEGETTLPYSAEWIQVPRNPHCLVCGPLHANVADEAAALSLDELAGMGNVTLEDNES